MEQLLSIQDAAKKLGGISKWTLHAWLSHNKISRVKVGSRTMVKESDLEKLIEVGGKSRAPQVAKD